MKKNSLVDMHLMCEINFKRKIEILFVSIAVSHACSVLKQIIHKL